MTATLAEARPFAVLVWAASCIYRRGARSAFTRRLRFVLRALLIRRLAVGWIVSLVDGPMRAAALRTPRMFEKPQRLYLNRHWRAAERHATLCEHYDWLCRAFSPAQIDQLFSETGLRLAVIETALPQPVGLTLRYDPGFEREGELALSLRIADRTIVSLAFTLGRDPLGRRQLMIGSLQGRSAADALDTVRELTRALHGLRPKALLVATAQALAAATGAARVLAVADEAHVFRGLRYLLKRHLIGQHRVFAQYDGLWSECGGEPRRDGFFELSTQSARRDPALIASNKRAMYRRRYAMLDAIEQQLRQQPIAWSGNGVVVVSREKQRPQTSQQLETCSPCEARDNRQRVDSE